MESPGVTCEVMLHAFVRQIHLPIDVLPQPLQCRKTMFSGLLLSEFDAMMGADVDANRSGSSRVSYSQDVKK